MEFADVRVSIQFSYYVSFSENEQQGLFFPDLMPMIRYMMNLIGNKIQKCLLTYLRRNMYWMGLCFFPGVDVGYGKNA